MANLKRYNVILLRHKNNQWQKDKVIFELCIIENSGYNFTIDQLYEKINSIVLPEDIKIQLKLTHSAMPRRGYPGSIIDALKKEGWKSTENIGLGTYKFYVYLGDCVLNLKKALWEESMLSRIEWTFLSFLILVKKKKSQWT
ncbi:Mrh transcription modulator under heat shock [Pectobacterium bacteriophage PM2]|uniref:Uncharacterized protein n=1 Tax=Pectobacterium bacteriophage PM2 TaxID=1429794 RepID=A0A0A0Q3A5_9CAUD|nr:Mrh transcription modulator under heat shock [Pectobacterium bacteriophage PM2]AHY24982.1 hypothetical protein PM2_020 [Pectobacterium bacteriophage PM2]